MIREFKQSDMLKVQEIANLAWSAIYKMMRENLGDNIRNIINTNSDDNGKSQQIKAEIEDANYKYLVCEEDDVVVGFVSYNLDYQKKIGTISHNAVDPRCGLKGKGQEMYKAVLDIFRQEGMSVAKVFTGLDNAHEPARKAYMRAGFNKKLEHITYFMEL